MPPAGQGPDPVAGEVAGSTHQLVLAEGGPWRSWRPLRPGGASRPHPRITLGQRMLVTLEGTAHDRGWGGPQNMLTQAPAQTHTHLLTLGAHVSWGSREALRASVTLEDRGREQVRERVREKAPLCHHREWGWRQAPGTSGPPRPRTTPSHRERLRGADHGVLATEPVSARRVCVCVCVGAHAGDGPRTHARSPARPQPHATSGCSRPSHVSSVTSELCRRLCRADGAWSRSRAVRLSTWNGLSLGRLLAGSRVWLPGRPPPPLLHAALRTVSLLLVATPAPRHGHPA